MTFLTAWPSNGFRRREVEKELARREYRTELECKSRTDLQSLAKDYGIPANLKSNAIIDGILHWEYDDLLGISGASTVFDLTYIVKFETMEAVRSLMNRINEKSSTACGAKCILDCVMKVEAELSALNAVKPAVIDHTPGGISRVMARRLCVLRIPCLHALRP